MSNEEGTSSHHQIMILTPFAFPINFSVGIFVDERFEDGEYSLLCHPFRPVDALHQLFEFAFCRVVHALSPPCNPG